MSPLRSGPLRAAGAAALMALLLGASCDDPLPPLPGDLAVEMLTQQVGLRALLVTIVGKVDNLAVPEGVSFRAFSAPIGTDTTRVAIVSREASPLTTGPILILGVPDVNAASSYRITVDEAASASYALINIGFVLLSLTRP